MVLTPVNGIRWLLLLAAIIVAAFGAVNATDLSAARLACVALGLIAAALMTIGAADVVKVA